MLSEKLDKMLEDINNQLVLRELCEEKKYIDEKNEYKDFIVAHSVILACITFSLYTFLEYNIDRILIFAIIYTVNIHLFELALRFMRQKKYSDIMPIFKKKNIMNYNFHGISYINNKLLENKDLMKEVVIRKSIEFYNFEEIVIELESLIEEESAEQISVNKTRIDSLLTKLNKVCEKETILKLKKRIKEVNNIRSIRKIEK